MVFHTLKLTKEYNVSSHCLRDMTKLNHCQKCYGYTQVINTIFIIVKAAELSILECCTDNSKYQLVFSGSCTDIPENLLPSYNHNIN